MESCTAKATVLLENPRGTPIGSKNFRVAVKKLLNADISNDFKVFYDSNASEVFDITDESLSKLSAQTLYVRK